MTAQSVNISGFTERLCGFSVAAILPQLFLGLGSRKNAHFLSSRPPKILGTLDEGKKRSSPKLVCQIQLTVSVHFLAHFVGGVVQPLQLQYTSLTVFCLLKKHKVIKPLK